MNSKALRKAHFASKENDSPNRDNGIEHNNEHEYEDYWDELYDEGVRETQMDKLRRSNKRNRKEDR